MRSLYCIAGIFRRRKFRDFVQNQTFCSLNFKIEIEQRVGAAAKVVRAMRKEVLERRELLKKT